MRDFKLRYPLCMLVGTVSIAYTTHAETLRSEKRISAKPLNHSATNFRYRNAHRPVASHTSYSNTRVYVTRGRILPDPRRKLTGRIGILGGLSQVVSGSSEIEGARSDLNLHQNILLGANADIRMWQYLGVELDIFYGLAPKREQAMEEIPDATFSSSLQHYGGLIALKTQLTVGSFVPKVGVGYGILGLKHLASDDGFTTKTGLRMSAPLALVGLDFNVGRTLTFCADYARSIAGSGAYEIETEGFSPSSSDFQRTLYDRIRVSGYWRFTPGFLGGAQFVRRFIETDYNGIGGTAPSGQETLTQILAIAGFEF